MANQLDLMLILDLFEIQTQFGLWQKVEKGFSSSSF